MTKEELKEYIAPYHKQQDELIGTIKKYDNRLHQNDFDKEFSDYIKVDNKIYQNNKHGGFFTGLTFGMNRGIADPMNAFWSNWLHLLQCMVEAGKVRLEGKLPDVYYCIT